jgi:6-pyruvoyltetrahydropterin/6-carboxytetrahydropterin synthase
VVKVKSIRITKIFTFDSAHQLEDYAGKCRQLHGHTYKLEVTVKGEMGESGMVFDFSILKKVVTERVISQLDHKYLNEVFDFNPTSENMVVWIFEQIDGCFEGQPCVLDGVKLWETATSYAELRRSDIEI